MTGRAITPRFFRTPAAFRKWLERNHAKSRELWVGFWNKASGRGGITYPQALDEALCYGWIDGLRKRVDADSYRIRFTPRRKTSIWSAVNIGHVKRLKAAGRMHRAGLDAFEKRTREAAPYSYEVRRFSFPPEYERRIAANAEASAYLESRPPGYRRAVTRWVMDAKKEETRLRRLEKLIAESARRRPTPPLG